MVTSTPSNPYSLDLGETTCTMTLLDFPHGDKAFNSCLMLTGATVQSFILMAIHFYELPRAVRDQVTSIAYPDIQVLPPCYLRTSSCSEEGFVQI